MSILETRDITWCSTEDCAATASQLAAHHALRSAVIELHGELGAGKTTFVRHLLQSLGVKGTIKSPSYAVMEPYDLPGLRISHFDFYRFNDPQEWEDAGFRDVFAESGLKLVEWPDNAAGLLPTPDLRIEIRIAPGAQDDSGTSTRHVCIAACTPLGTQLLP